MKSTTRSFRRQAFTSSLFALLIGLPSAHAVVDRDNNQLSDIWELKFSTGSLSATLDSDGDGFTNLQESVLGTDPLDNASRITTSTEMTNSTSLTTRWPSVLYKRYQLETSTTLSDWTVATTLAGTGASLAYTANTDGAARFFTRVKVADIDTDEDGLTDWEERQIGYDPKRKFTDGIGNKADFKTVRNDLTKVQDLLAGTAAHVVTIGASDPHMAENWPDKGTVVIRRTGRITPVTINYTIGGTATAGIDYADPAFRSVTLALGDDEKTVSFTPLADSLTEGDETITVTLLPGTGYTLGTATTATLKIADAADGKPALKASLRFLQQTTFGPAPGETDRVRELGFAGWLDEQFARPANLHVPFVKAWNRDLGFVEKSDETVQQGFRLFTLWTLAMRTGTDADPLRQRAAYSLSQIFPVSDDLLHLNGYLPVEYYDTLVSNAFGNYRTLLEAISREPLMAIYLSSLRNRKANPSINRYPDQNFAREVMQLFSIGLWRLNPDGSRLLSDGTHLDPDGLVVPKGDPIPSYGQQQVQVMARVFTGLSHPTQLTGTPKTEQPASFSNGWELPGKGLRMFDSEHDLDAKTIAFPGLAPLELPARTASNPDVGTAGNADLTAVFDLLASHPNVGPFISRLLIQRHVTSNPTPAYIARISAVFADNGSGVRGDLKAVFRAIFLDSEARDAARLDVASHGMVREPFVRLLAINRALEAAPVDAEATKGRYYFAGNYNEKLLQQPLTPPSVFNFYSPDHPAPGAAGEAGLVSPELQIINSVTAITGPQLIRTAFNLPTDTTSATSDSTINATQFNDRYKTASDTSTTILDESKFNVRANEVPWQALALEDTDKLVSALDLALCNGRMTPATFRAITRSVNRLPLPSSATTDVLRDRYKSARWRTAAYLTSISADAAFLQ